MLQQLTYNDQTINIEQSWWRSSCSESRLTATQTAEVWSQELELCFQPASSVYMCLAVLHWLVSPEACEHRFGTAVGGFLNTRSITKAARYGLLSSCEHTIVAFFYINRKCHAFKRPPDVILHKSFTRPSTTLAVIKVCMGTRLIKMCSLSHCQAHRSVKCDPSPPFTWTCV